VALLAHEVDREVAAGLEDPDLAVLLQRDAAGAEVGDAAVLERDPGVGDILGLRDDRDADSVDALDGRIGQLQDDTDIMDHQVQHDADLGATGREGSQTLGGDVAGVDDGLLEVGHHRVVVLDVSDLDDAVGLGGGLEDLGGLREGDADRLLNQEVDALGQQGQRDGGMMIGRDDDAHGVAGGRHLIEGGEAPAAVLGADFGRAGVIRLEDAGKFGAGQGRVDTGVVLAERTRAGHPAADARSGHGRQDSAGAGLLQSENPPATTSKASASWSRRTRTRLPSGILPPRRSRARGVSSSRCRKRRSGRAP